MQSTQSSNEVPWWVRENVNNKCKLRAFNVVQHQYYENISNLPFGKL